LFLTEEKVLKKIAQDRARNDLKRVRERALDAFERWPDNFDLAMEAIQVCIELGDNHKAVALLKKAIVRHAKKRSQIEEYALDVFHGSQNPFLGSFLVELRLKRRDVEGIRLILKQSSESFIEDLIKRSETRRQGETKGAGSIDNDILLGLLYIESKQSDKAAAPFGRVIVADPDSAQTFGGILVELEREMPNNAELKFQLARTSILLSHPDKAESRLFQCLELTDPPLEGILETLDETPEKSHNHLLLKGETLIRMERNAEGIDCLRAFLAEEGDTQSGTGSMSHLFPAREDRQALVESRMRLFPDGCFSDPGVTFLYCDVASARGKSKDAAGRMENLFRSGSGHAAGIIDWCEKNDEHILAGETKRLLAELYLESEEYDKGAAAVRSAVEDDRTLLPSLLDLVRNAVEGAAETHPQLNKILAELYARAGDGESASEVLASLTGMEKIDNEDILNLSGEIMKHAGVSIDGVVHNVEASIKSGNIVDSAPYVKSLCVERPDSVQDLARTLQRKAEGNDSYWQPLADLLDYLAKDEKPPKPMAFLQALSHLESGSIEKAIFEFDQLLMLDGDLRHDLIPLYERATERHDANATLHLALYQLHLEDGQLSLAAHYLCHMIEIDPEQVKDVLQRFDKLVEMEPDNISIWEEMLKSALASNRVSLAREILKRAIQTLSDEQSAALHVYGTKVSISDGNFEDALKCIAVALKGKETDLRTIAEQLESILMAASNNQEARFLLADAYLRLGREENAVAAFRDCLSLSDAYADKIQKHIDQALPASIKPWLLSSLLAEIAWSEKRFDDAYRLFATAQQGSGESLTELGRTLERLYETSPGNTQLALVYARNLHLMESHDECVALLEDISSVDEASAKRAFEILFEVLDRNPDHFGANRLFAKLAAEAGNEEQSLEPVVRMLAHDEIDPDELDDIVSSYSKVHMNKGAFLIPYAGLKARKKECGEALASYRKALELESDSWERVIEGIDRHEWPDEARRRSEMLKIDCLISGNRLDEALEQLRSQQPGEPQHANELIRRLENLIEREPRNEYFILGASWLAKIGDIDGAEKLLYRGCELLGEKESSGFRIELVEILHDAGMFDRAAPILEELISSSDDKASILKSMERSYIRRTEQEIGRLSTDSDTESLAAGDTERYIWLCIDCGRTEDARRALFDSDLPREKRTYLLSEIYLAEARPASLLALFGSCSNLVDPETEEGVRTLYAAGLASEMLGDYGGAYAAFSRILASGRTYRDSGERAESNHTRFIESSLGEKVLVLEAVGSLDGLHGGEDTK
jgi:lipopolysaccharide biosynthesis regulator YciM